MTKHFFAPATIPVILLLLPVDLQAQTPSGAEIYKNSCQKCHGVSGQGTRRYKKKLVGDLSLAQLTDQIKKTMPEDDPGTLSDADAKAVATYMHGAFYSALARERDRPARVELSRLTVKQYRQSVADLIAHFRTPTIRAGENGLKAEYYKGRGFRPQDRVLSRIDPEVAFDFGTQAPVKEKMEHHRFSIRWSGSLLAPETGEYTFVVRTEHAARLWVNDVQRPVLDAWVKSGNDTEYKTTLYLVAGRLYPIRLEYSKSKQGVDDSAKLKKIPEVKSSIAFLWRPPHKAVGVIPEQNLRTAGTPEVYSCSTPFPPDDRSYGWERGTTVSREWDQATTNAALETAAYIAPRLNELAGTRDDASDRVKKLQLFAQAFAERAYRRPLNGEQKALIDRQFRAVNDPGLAVKRVVLLTLKSPSFLYREAGGDSFAIASRLSYGLWDAMPDRELLLAAASGKLSNEKEVRGQIERMLRDPRARVKLRDFLLAWLRADGEHDTGKNPQKYPGFDGGVVSDLHTSLELFLDDIVWSEKADFRDLLLSEELFLNGRLAKVYGGKLPENAPFQKAKVEVDKRAGVLTHPYLMSRFADTMESSPIHRGVFLARGVLGVALRTPPEAVAPLAPDLHPKLTTRERVEMQTRPNICMSCHTVINSLGFTLENYDAIGRYREREKDRTIDARGYYLTREGKTVKFTGARELARFLAESPEVHASFAEQMLHFLVQQPVRAYGPDTLEELRKSFVADKFHLRKLAAEILLRTALKPLPGTNKPPKGQ